jgi:hypothetical protein
MRAAIRKHFLNTEAVNIIYCNMIRQNVWAKENESAMHFILQMGPFHLIYTPPYGREFLRGFEKAVSEGLCASASFDLCIFSEG